MLILTRRENEDIIIGDGLITISVLGVSGRQVKLGIDAPKEVPVHRSEIFQRIEEERRQGLEQAS